MGKRIKGIKKEREGLQREVRPSKKNKNSLGTAFGNKVRRIKRRLDYLGKGRTDFWIGMTTFSLLIFGVLMAFSAAYYTEIAKGNSPYWFLIKDGILATLGLIFMIGFSYIDYRKFKKLRILIAVGTIFLFLGLFTPLGINVNGATRWLNLIVFTVMPGEIAKIATIIWTASILSDAREDVNSYFSLGKIWLLVVIYVVFIMWQPNMSTAMTVVFITVSMLFVAGLKTNYFFGAIGLVATIIAGLVIFGEEYRIKRYTTFLDPFNDPTGDSWQVMQSLLAIGSGGILGKGPGGSVQKALYLPEAQTDFILAIIGEELGFWGICLMVAAFTFLIWKGLIVAMNAPDRFGMLLASGIVMMIGIQVLLNMAIVTSSMPGDGSIFTLCELWGKCDHSLLCYNRNFDEYIKKKQFEKRRRF